MEMSREERLEELKFMLRKDPGKLVRLCLQLYEEKDSLLQREAEQRRRADGSLAREAEQKRRADGILAMYESEKETFRRAADENRRLLTLLSEYRDREETLREEAGLYRKNHEQAVKDIARLTDELAEAVQEKVKAVSHGKELQDRLDLLTAENAELGDKIRLLQEQIRLGNRDRFGHTTEKTGGLFGAGEADGDPLSEDAPCEDETGKEGDKPDENASGKRNGNDAGNGSGSYGAEGVVKRIHSRIKEEKPEGKSGGRKRKPSRKDKIFDTITDYVYYYDYDMEELDRKYGKGNYRIVDFDCKRELRETRPHNYAYCTYTPVIVVREPDGGKKIVSVKPKESFYPGSFASVSLVASVLYKRFGLAVPLYRLEQEYKARNVLLSRQVMSSWVLKFGYGVFGLAHDRLEEELGTGYTVQQCDESVWRVVIWPEEDGKRNGSNGYVWVQTTGELEDGRKIILYTFEKTRNADHLRKHLGRLVKYLVSDAYSGYMAVESERGGTLSVANCWMHCRRMWARAFVVTEDTLAGLSEQELLQIPEVKGLLLSNDIFTEDTPLKKLDADTRNAERKLKVKPCVDAFFEFVHSINPDDPEVTGKLREAVVYSLNQEERLKVFLEDGRIPLDNGYCERCVKPIALARRNSMFSYSVSGAECNAILYSIVETARANGADIYTYLKYLLSEVPKHLDGTDRGFLKEMMPWSPAYREYERRERESHADERMPESNEPPQGMTFVPKNKRSA